MLNKAAVTSNVGSANAELFEIRNLSVGKPAPEISGEDIDAKPFKLSDYRGKVVCLTFWAEWSESCRAMLPLERSLVERMQGKPFVLLGVNGDSDKGKLRELMKRENITWRCVVRRGRQCQQPGADRPPVPRERLADGLHHRPARRDPPQDARRPCLEEIQLGDRCACRGRPIARDLGPGSSLIAVRTARIRPSRWSKTAIVTLKIT